MDSATPLYPAHEPSRLAALRPYQVLGEVADPLLDEVVRLIAALYDVPIALVSLVEEDTVLFKAQRGFPHPQRVARTDSLCAVAVLAAETTVFSDLLTQPCTLVNPLAVRALNLQFYAGHALRTSAGQHIGTLCVIDHRPRPFSAPERDLLARLAGLVMRLLDRQVQAADAPAAASWEPLVLAQLAASVGALEALTAPHPSQQPRGEPRAAPVDPAARAAQMQRLVDVLDAHLA